MSRSRRTRADIADAALRIAETDGIRAITIDRVATLAGLSKGGVLHHFPSKEALLDATHRAIWDASEARALAALAKPYELASHDERLRALVRGTIDGPPRIGELLLAIDRGRDDVDERGRAFLRRWSGHGERALRARQRLAILAADGLWLAEAAGYADLDAGERAELRDAVLSLLDGG